MERTFVLLKPDAVGRNLNFQIQERFEKKGFTLVACCMQQCSKERAEQHYAPLKGKAGFEDAVNFLCTGPCIATAWQAPNVITAAKQLAGDADPAKAAMGTVRGDFALEPARNLLECSADAAAAKRELALWFTAAELAPSAVVTVSDAPAKAATSSTPRLRGRWAARPLATRLHEHGIVATRHPRGRRLGRRE